MLDGRLGGGDGGGGGDGEADGGGGEGEAEGGGGDGDAEGGAEGGKHALFFQHSCDPPFNAQADDQLPVKVCPPVSHASSLS